METSLALVGCCIASAHWTRSVQRASNPGYSRLLLCLPVLAVYQYSPVPFDQQTNILGKVIAAACLSWWATFKVVGMCFGRGKLSGDMTLVQYTTALLLPIITDGVEDRKVAEKATKSQSSTTFFVLWLLKLGVLGAVVGCLVMYAGMPPMLRDLLYAVGLYAVIGVIMDGPAAVAVSTIGMSTHPCFHSPFVSTSLAAFWGRRWNLMAGSLLRMLVYEPITEGSLVAPARGATPAGRHQGITATQVVAVVATFTMSGLCHELVLLHANPRLTGEWLAFFSLQAVGVVGERALYAGVGKPSAGVGWAMTMGFLFGTAELLFFPVCERWGLSSRVVDQLHACFYAS